MCRVITRRSDTLHVITPRNGSRAPTPSGLQAGRADNMAPLPQLSAPQKRTEGSAKGAVVQYNGEILATDDPAQLTHVSRHSQHSFHPPQSQESE